MSVHFVIKCKQCEKITGQCRCPSKDKSIRWITCAECSGFNQYVPKEKK